MSPALEGLLSRIEAAMGPDRELDDDLWMALCWEHHFREIARGSMSFTGSVDSALALVERVLPGAQWEITNLYGAAKAELPLNHGDGSVHGAWREDGNIPLAILSALLKALIAKEADRAP